MGLPVLLLIHGGVERRDRLCAVMSSCACLLVGGLFLLFVRFFVCVFASFFKGRGGGACHSFARLIVMYI